MILQSTDTLKRGDLVFVKLRPYFLRGAALKQVVYWSTERDGQCGGRFTLDHFIGQNIDQGSIYQQQILEYVVRRVHATMDGETLECNQFSLQRFDPAQKGYAERRSLLTERGVWVPERGIIVPVKMIQTMGDILNPKIESSNVRPLYDFRVFPNYLY